MYNDPDSLFEKQLNTIFSRRTPDGKSSLLQVMSIIFAQNKHATELSTIYDEIGLDNLSKLVNILNGHNLSLPSRAEFQDLIILSLCYYYKEVEQLTWAEITKLVPFEISPITYGRKINAINKSLKKTIEEIFIVEEE